MPRRVSSSCTKPQTDFSKLHIVSAHTTAIFDWDLLHEIKRTLYHECAETKLPVQLMCMSDASGWLVRNALETQCLVSQTNSISYELISMRLGTSSGFSVHVL